MMRALIVTADPTPLLPVERWLTEREWVVRYTRLHVASEELPFEPQTLVVLAEDPCGGGAVFCSTLRAREREGRSYVLAVLRENERASLHALTAAGVDDVIFGPLTDEDVDLRLQLAHLRIAAAAGDAAPLPASSEEGQLLHDLRVQLAFLEGIFESAPEAIAILNEEDYVARINAEFTRLFGYTQEEVRGRRLWDLVVPAHLASEVAELRRRVAAGEHYQLETTRRDRDGRLIEVSMLAAPIRVNGPVGAFVIYRDITHRRRQEAALRESEVRYRALFDQSPVGVFLCDRDLRVTHCNEQLARILGAPYEEIVGTDLLRLRSSRLLPGLRAALRGEPAFYEGPYLAPTGRYLHVSVQYAPLRADDGTVVGGIGVLADVTQRVSAEKQLRAQAAQMERVNEVLQERTLELEAAMRARNRLYSAMNHELRTPISAIMLYHELLMSGTLGDLTDEQIHALESSHTAARHLLELVRDILDLSKIEAGKAMVQPVEVSLDSLLTELRASIAPLTEQYGSGLVLEVDGNAGSIVTDPQRLRQIVMNFVSNAAKYGRRNPVLVRCYRCNDGVAIEVIDRGIGIPREHIDHIFEDFVQLGPKSDEGTGLGLAICRRLADLLGAKLEVESEVDVGSTFRVVLPSAPHLVEADGVSA